MLEDKFGDCSGNMSRAWRFVLRRNPPWQGCCEDHDYYYREGGGYFWRKVADKNLRRCVADRGFPTIAKLMYYAVRVGGLPFLPTPWRWGFGGYPYKPWRLGFWKSIYSETSRYFEV